MDGTIRMAFRLFKLFITEENGKIQALLFFDRIVTVTEFEDYKFTIEEITGNTNPKEPEELADSLVKEGNDWAVERADLPGKEINMYMGRQCLAGHAVDEAG